MMMLYAAIVLQWTQTLCCCCIWWTHNVSRSQLDYAHRLPLKVTFSGLIIQWKDITKTNILVQNGIFYSLRRCLVGHVLQDQLWVILCCLNAVKYIIWLNDTLVQTQNAKLYRCTMCNFLAYVSLWIWLDCVVDRYGVKRLKFDTS